jgi:hypothetical protein
MTAGSALLSWIWRDSRMLKLNLTGSTQAADCFTATLSASCAKAACFFAQLILCRLHIYTISIASCAVLLGHAAPVVSAQLWEHPQQQWARLLPVHWDGGRQLLLRGACRKRHGSSSGSGTTLHRSSTLQHTACHLDLHHFRVFQARPELHCSAVQYATPTLSTLPVQVQSPCCMPATMPAAAAAAVSSPIGGPMKGPPLLPYGPGGP